MTGLEYQQTGSSYQGQANATLKMDCRFDPLKKKVPKSAP
jgi:hypothetical protein